MHRIAVALGTIVVLVLLAAPALATDNATIPHGGFSTTTDACLQCHDIHESAGDYVLMRQQTMTATCGTCHTLYQAAPTGAYNPGYSGTEAGTAADLMAYKVPQAQALTHEGHRLGLGSGSRVFADGQTGDGSYIPGGTQSLTAIQYLSYPATTTALAYTAVNGMSCASCHAPHGSFGNVVDSAVSTKLLTSKPNHQTNSVPPMANWVDDGGDWCGACHDKRLPGADQNGELHYNHPGEQCLTCHGNEMDPISGSEEATDFPHTGSLNLLTLEPDMLCLQCHVAGTLP
ncbi:MAG: hypothetical protein C4521_07260 [Actinobacteria bacterium]|nr:MAG: hypothetical protein C4521_07260 [Actinomycetota bacterium]